MKSLKLFEKSPVRVGGGDLGMWKRTLMGCMSEFGGSPLASSMAVMPRDQMSACRETQSSVCYAMMLHSEFTERKNLKSKTLNLWQIFLQQEAFKEVICKNINWKEGRAKREKERKQTMSITR